MLLSKRFERVSLAFPPCGNVTRKGHLSTLGDPESSRVLSSDFPGSKIRRRKTKKAGQSAAEKTIPQRVAIQMHHEEDRKEGDRAPGPRKNPKC